ncbi:major facilitator superfamily domain-containing protein [Lipomyces kononenkoae]|uniref:Major facilitator superfamily domain-containing protein n=1 Tax=Lipomyces kononenkoae TaxID=34357 RepID=A0ACC3ST03_LIPKO
MDCRDGLDEDIQPGVTKEVQVHLQASSYSTAATEPDGRQWKFSDPDMENIVTDIEELQLSPLEKDPIIVDWDGPDDPAMALNWPLKKKWTTIVLLSTLTLLTPFASSMFAPSMTQVMQEFHSTNETIASFVVSVYLLGYAFGPLILAPFSELYGRLPVYHITVLLFILFNIACAKSFNLSMLIVFRFLTGVGGSGPLTIGPGSIADCFSQADRGKVMAIWTLPVLLGPSIGPVAGGYLSDSLGWRWDFWFLCIVTGVAYIMSLIIQRETYPPAILSRKVRRLRKSMPDRQFQSALHSTKSPAKLFFTSILRPTKLLLFSPIVLGLSIYTAIAYGILYLIFTTIPDVFERQYGFSSNNVGLTYLGTGVGQFVGLISFGAASDLIVKKMAKGGELKPEYRLVPVLLGGCLLPIGLLWYGWTAEYKIFWIVPIIGMVLIGAGMITIFVPVSTYLVDAFTTYAASATAANTVLRSLGGAFLPLCGMKLESALGIGWSNSLLAFVALALIPVICVFIKYGERIRTHPRFQLDL